MVLAAGGGLSWPLARLRPVVPLGIAAVCLSTEIVVVWSRMIVTYSGGAGGWLALRRLASDVGLKEEPVLWPEHLDVALAHDEVNFGVSPGDAWAAVPYAYVGPWEPRRGDFWTAPFGAARRLDELGGADGVAAFFAEGRRRAAEDPRT